MDNSTRMEVQQVFTCCGFDKKFNMEHPDIGYTSCEDIEVGDPDQEFQSQ